jgi:EAL domain-containing protein (putative c-di-GMP-specific phosphodiesterase class I)/GGDEF domain-containing protein
MLEKTLKSLPADRKKRERPFSILALLLALQVLFAYAISKFGISENIFSQLMYLPIITAGYLFDYRIGILSGVIAELLIEVFATESLALFQPQRLYAASFRVFFFMSCGYITGKIKQRMDEMKIPATHPKIHLFTQLPYWGSITEEMNSLLSNDKILHFRFFLIEISNQNVLFATYGLDYIDKVNQIIIAKLKSHYKGCKLFLVRLNTFAMILPEVRQDVEELVRLFEQPILVNGIPIYCEVTIGEASYPEGGQTADAILKNGFVALNEAQLHQKPYQQYQPKLHNPEISVLLGQFQNAIQNQEIEFHYQPIVDTNGKVHSLEALVRWNHPVKGMIPPDQFIPDLEFTRITNILTYYSLEYNLNNMARLYQEGFNLDISINISITNLYQPDFASRVIAILAKHNFPCHHLELEITERGFLADNPECRSNLDDLVKAGIKLSIDDFGVGFTSISNFRNEMIYSIKIDKSFVEEIHANPANQAILEGIIAIAKASNVAVIAEGIEKQSEKEKLVELGVDYLQGYLISTPRSYASIRSWLIDSSLRAGKLPSEEIPEK